MDVEQHAPSSGGGALLGRVSSIVVYPVKSARGVNLTSAVVTPTGLEHDRRWMVVDDDGRFLTQREEPRLCRVVPSLDEHGLSLSAPGMQSVRAWPPQAGARLDRARRTVRVWGDSVAAELAPQRVSEWLSDYLGASYHLAYMAADTVRRVDPDYAGPADRVGFADAFPFLIIGQASLDDLNARLVERGHDALPMNRFRPNLVVDGCPAYAEDGWRAVRIGAIGFRVLKPCARCVITTTDQATGVTSREPLATLATYRRVGSGVMFGQNACHDATGSLAVGDEVVQAAG